MTPAAEFASSPRVSQPLHLHNMSIAELPITIERQRLAAFCRERGIRKLSLFGSVLRQDFDPLRSDVDVLAEFEPGALLKAGWNYFGYGEELGQLLGRKVDFCSRLHPLIHSRVKDNLLTLYERSRRLSGNRIRSEEFEPK